MLNLVKEYVTEVKRPLKRKPKFEDLLPCEWAATLDRMYPQLDTSFLESTHPNYMTITQDEFVERIIKGLLFSDKRKVVRKVKHRIPLPRYAVWDATEASCQIDRNGYKYWTGTDCSRTTKALGRVCGAEIPAYQVRNNLRLFCHVTTLIPPKLKKQRDMLHDAAANSTAEIHREICFYVIAETTPEHWREGTPEEADPMLVVHAFGKFWLMGIWDATTGESEAYLTYTK